MQDRSLIILTKWPTNILVTVIVDGIIYSLLRPFEWMDSHDEMMFVNQGEHYSLSEPGRLCSNCVTMLQLQSSEQGL